jgi:hypothetical protein
MGKGEPLVQRPPNRLEMSRPASSRILLDEPTPQLARSAPSSC